MMKIQDPIHGYITLKDMYADIVNTPEFQRLRSVEQVNFHPVYPSARHDRFTHSLGTYHLATKFVEHFFNNLHDDVGIVLSDAEKVMLGTTFRYAALLHDVGHAPLSHTTENFFLEPRDSSGMPRIWSQLCEAVKTFSPQEYTLFRRTSKHVGAAHEIMSALLLVSDRDKYTPSKERLDVNLALAARMVIGFTYGPNDLSAFTNPADPMAPTSIQDLGIRNCLIQMLNSSILDVDRLDYLGRDTQMTGFFNAPLDLDALAASVTAAKLDNSTAAPLPVELPSGAAVNLPDGTVITLPEGATMKLPQSAPKALPDGWLVPAYRDAALRVFDLMFQAKLSHDAWVVASPAGPYDAALRVHCIRQLNHKIDSSYMSTIFSPKALSREGVTLKGKHYRLLNDVDVFADLKAQDGDIFDELFTRDLSDRRVAAWRSYYEFHHFFNAPQIGVTPEAVYEYFKPLLNYMEKHHIFVFDAKAYSRISTSGDVKVLQAAVFLRQFLRDQLSDDKKANYNAVLLKRTNNFTLKVDPEDIRIVFAKDNVSLRADGRKYSTYAELTGARKEHNRARPYFYLYRHGVLGRKQMKDLRNRLANVL